MNKIVAFDFVPGFFWLLRSWGHFIEDSILCPICDGLFSRKTSARLELDHIAMVHELRWTPRWKTGQFACGCSAWIYAGIKITHMFLIVVHAMQTHTLWCLCIQALGHFHVPPHLSTLAFHSKIIFTCRDWVHCWHIACDDWFSCAFLRVLICTMQIGSNDLTLQLISAPHSNSIVCVNWFTSLELSIVECFSLPLGDIFLSRNIGAWIDSESHACISVKRSKWMFTRMTHIWMSPPLCFHTNLSNDISCAVQWHFHVLCNVIWCDIRMMLNVLYNKHLFHVLCNEIWCAVQLYLMRCALIFCAMCNATWCIVHWYLMHYENRSNGCIW